MCGPEKPTEVTRGSIVVRAAVRAAVRDAEDGRRARRRRNGLVECNGHRRRRHVGPVATQGNDATQYWEYPAMNPEWPPRRL